MSCFEYRYKLICQCFYFTCIEIDADAETLEETSTSASSEEDDGPPTFDTWELDFSSRPILDERGKKRWELLICSPDSSWRFPRFFPNNKINSTQV